MTLRKARVTRGNIRTKEVEAYLPRGYEVVRKIDKNTVEIAGRDHAGWTLDGYVLPRLWSGLFGAEEIK